MEIKYEIKGITLTASDMGAICEYYEAACTAEHLMDNYDAISDEETAMNLAYEVRRQMNKYSIEEEEAIYSVLKAAGLLNRV